MICYETRPHPAEKFSQEIKSKSSFPFVLELLVVDPVICWFVGELFPFNVMESMQFLSRQGNTK